MKRRREDAQKHSNEYALATKVWSVGDYVRLSRDVVGPQAVSESIENQIGMLNAHIERLAQSSDDEYTVYKVYADDGYTAAVTNRPSFQAMIADIEAGKINCVIVNDLSRSFRNSADQAYYLEQYFPYMKVRFIALRDNIDSYLNPRSMKSIAVPFTGVMNEYHVTNTSNSVKDVFNLKRSNGEFIGAFSPYGYEKDPEDKNRLVIDEEAAIIVKDIFNMFLEGYSKSGIAREFNNRGIPSPAGYKKMKGKKYMVHTMKLDRALWYGETVNRILKNEVYIGTMVQGKEKILDPKSKMRLSVDPDEWYRVKNTHEPIIDQKTFEQVQSLMQVDSRRAPNKTKVYLFSGLLKCADCGRNLYRRDCGNKGRVYHYCRTPGQSQDVCKGSSVREDKLYNGVLAAIQEQAAIAIQLEKVINALDTAPISKSRKDQLSKLIQQHQDEIDQQTIFKKRAFEEWQKANISMEDYRSFSAKYDERIANVKVYIEELQIEMDNLSTAVSEENEYITHFKKCQGITSLTRELIVELIDSIIIDKNSEATIKFKFNDIYKQTLQCLSETTLNTLESSMTG